MTSFPDDYPYSFHRMRLEQLDCEVDQGISFSGYSTPNFDIHFSLKNVQRWLHTVELLLQISSDGVETSWTLTTYGGIVCILFAGYSAPNFGSVINMF